MRRSIIILGIILIIQALAVSAFAQQDKLVGRWEGKIKAPQGERATTLTFRKEGDAYTGKMPGLQPGSEIQLKEIKLEGNKLTAVADIDTPQGSITINYDFTLEGETLNGKGEIRSFGMSFDMNLTRASTDPASASPTPAGGGAAPPRRATVPQPQQKQSADYFVGQWSYKYVGRESALAPAPRECTLSITKRADGKTLDGAANCTADGKAYKESFVIVYDDATKMMTVVEKLGSGVTLNSRADWTSPISIRFTIDPVKAKGQSLQLRRTISVVAAHSFTIAEELSEDGGPFLRLGSAVVTRLDAK
ncbi:MAG TPA: hypothetical protein VKA70_14975 [Blastocatellia bacterium]|nr:hypothetical protein [Blastocatellia bacterium]